MPNVRIIAKGQRGDSLTKLKVTFAPEQSSTPSLMPETNSVYLTRPTEGTGELMELVGGSVAWNQLCNNGTSPVISASGVTFTVNNGTVTANGTATANSVCYINGLNTTPFVSGHKYLMRGCPSGGSSQTYFQRLNVNGSFVAAETGDGVVYACSNTGSYIGVACFVVSGTSVSNKVFKPQLIDLTSYFNDPTIADYVYSLEQSTAGSGIAWLQSYGFFTEDYYAYSAPTLQSVEATAHVTVGFNQWDEEWESGSLDNSGVPVSNPNMIRSKNFIPIIPGAKYYTHAPNPATYLWYYDSGQNFISFVTNNANHAVTVPANAHYAKLRIGDASNPATTYDHNICLNISKTTGTPKNGDYVPYWSETNTFGSVTLRGITELVNGTLRYNGDTYSWDGTVNRRFAEVDLGSLTWLPNGNDSVYGQISGKLSGGQNVFVQGLVQVPSNTSVNDMPLGSFKAYSSNKNIAVKVSGITDSNASTMLSGVYANYERATPTTESADPFTAVQTVEDGGTEEFVTTNNVPVGVVGRFANAVPMEGVDSFTVTANDGTSHTYPVTLSEEIYRGYVDMLTGEAVSDMASIAEYNGETISEPWLSSLDVYSLGATPTNGAQVVYPITPEEVTATITGDPTELGKVTSASSTEGTVEWSAMAPLDGKCIVRVVS